MGRFFLAVLVIAALVACKKGEAMDPLVKEAMQKLKETRDQGCACTDLPCITKVQNDLGHWYLDNAKRLEALKTKATPKQTAAGQALTTELEECAKKLEAAAKSEPPRQAPPQ
jgi:hypothetical protein